jgi:hypothetical protein
VYSLPLTISTLFENNPWREHHLLTGGGEMDIQDVKLRGFMSATTGLRNPSMIMVARDKNTDNFVVIAGKEIKRRWGIFNVPQGMWRVVCKKEEVKEAVDRLLTEKILS